MSEQRDNSGIMFKNDRKEKDTHADYQGECMIDGKPYWINAWIKEGKRGKFMSFAFKPKEARREAAAQDSRSELDSEIPF